MSQFSEGKRYWDYIWRDAVRDFPVQPQVKRTTGSVNYWQTGRRDIGDSCGARCSPPGAQPIEINELTARVEFSGHKAEQDESARDQKSGRWLRDLFRRRDVHLVDVEPVGVRGRDDDALELVAEGINCQKRGIVARYRRLKAQASTICPARPPYLSRGNLRLG
jgi:hypothetical protein